MKKSLVFVIGAAIVMAACSSTSVSTSTTTTEPALPQGKCSATSTSPTRGLAAITDTYLVHAWIDTSSDAPAEFSRIGDDPFDSPTEGEMTVVESVAISVDTCAVFVGACCEPASGLTYYGGEISGEWSMLMGRLPAVSPDGKILALVAYEQLVIAPVSSPEDATSVISIPSGETVNFVDSRWLNIDEVALLGVTELGTYIWIASVSQGTVSEPILLTDKVNWLSDNVVSLGIVGVDENGNIATRIPGATGGVLEYRYPDSLKIRSTNSLDANVMSYRITLDRSAMVTDNGVLTVWIGNNNPVQVGTQYVWAG